MRKTYYPSHSQNRMKNEGNVVAARKNFMLGKNRVLYHLIRQRFYWMNKFIKPSDETIIELGCGAGLSRQFIKSDKLVLTDVEYYEWVDRYADAMNLDFPDNSVDVIICSEMIHHLSNPARFLDSVSKKLKPGGRLIIQDIYTCPLMKLALRIMRHEGWSDSVKIFNREEICNDPTDPWSANCSIPKLLFFSDGFSTDNKEFSLQFPQYTILYKEVNECFLFFCSGGVIAKTRYLPLNDRGAKLLKRLDRFLVRCFPKLFACGCSVVLQKK